MDKLSLDDWKELEIEYKERQKRREIPSPKNHTQIDLILAVIEKKPLITMDLISFLTRISKFTVSTTLSKLTKEGKICRNKGPYPDSYHYWISSKKENEEN